MISKPFNPREEDIQSAMLYKKYFDPGHATREEAIAMLEDMNSDFHRMAHDNPEKLLELQQKVDKKSLTVQLTKQIVYCHTQGTSQFPKNGC